MERATTRRRFLSGVAAGLGASCWLGSLAGCGGEGSGVASSSGDGTLSDEGPIGPDGKPTPRKVELLLNWYPEAEHGGFFAAEALGFYREENLDVTIVDGGPGKPVSPQVDQGRFAFGIENADRILVFRARGADVVALFAPLHTSPRCILVHEESGITKLEDLANLTLAMNDDDPFAKFMRAKLPLPGVEVVAYTGGVKAFLARKDFAQQGYVFSEPILARRGGAKPRVLLVSDLGFNPYTSVLIARTETTRRAAAVVKAMVRASSRGWLAYLKDPAPINARIAARNPEMTEEFLAESAAALRPFCDNPATTDARRFGTMDPARWLELRDQLASLGFFESSAVDPAAAVFDAFGSPPPNGSVSANGSGVSSSNRLEQRPLSSAWFKV